MANTYRLELQAVRGISTDFVSLVMEVVVRTPRLLSTLRKKYATAPFPPHSAHDVTLEWTQAKNAKAFVRLKALPGGLGAGSGSGGNEVMGAGAGDVVMADAGAPAAEGKGSPKDAGGMTLKSAPVPLPLVPPGAQGPVRQRLSLPMVADARGNDRGGGSNGGDGDGGELAGYVAEVDLLLCSLTAFTASSSAAGCTPAGPQDAGSPAVGATSGSGGHTATTQAWMEPAPARAPTGTAFSGPAPAPAPAPMPLAAHRKRSWLLALGLGRHTGTDGDVTATVAPPGAAGPTCERVSPLPLPSAASTGGASGANGSGGAVEALRLCGGGAPSRVGLARSAGDPISRGSSEAGGGSAARLADVNGSGIAGPEGGLSVGSRRLPVVWDHVGALARAATSSVSSLAMGPELVAPSPRAADSAEGVGSGQGPQWGSGSGMPGYTRTPKLPNALSSGGGAVAAAAAPPPLASKDLVAGHSVPPAQGSCNDEADLATRRPHAPQNADGVTATGGLRTGGLSSLSCTDPQPPKRRRLGDLLSRLFNPSGGAAARQVAGQEPISANSCPTLPSGASTASRSTPTAAAPAPAPSANSSVAPPRRHNCHAGITPLLPPSPRLGDVYRVQDNAMASDTGVQLGFGPAPAGNGAVGDGPGPPSGSCLPDLLRGLESPGYGALSPAGGPDRLTVEPPVDDLAAASLTTPMAISPTTPTGGCFLWRKTAAVRAKAAANAAAAAAATPCASIPASSTATADPGGGKPPLGEGVPARAVASLPASGVGRTGEVRNAGCLRAPVATSAGSASTGSVTKATRQASSKARLLLPQTSSQTQVPPAAPPPPSLPPPQPSTTERKAVPANCDNSWSGPLESEISRVVAFIEGQTGIDDDLRAASLSQCQFLLDCLQNPDTCWLVGDSLLQLKFEVGFPFDTGVPIAGAHDWFRLLLRPLELLVPPPPPPPPVLEELQDGEDAAAAAPWAPPPPPPPRAPEVLKVRWAPIDQRQVGGSNACAAIVLEVTAWCLDAVQRCRAAGAAPTLGPHVAEGAGAAVGSAGRRELAPGLSRSQRERQAAAEAPMDAMSGGALERCINTGTEIWQAVLVQSPAARVASSTGDFDLEHMLTLGGYSQRLRLADYTAASLLEVAGSDNMTKPVSGPGGASSSGGSGGGCGGRTHGVGGGGGSAPHPQPPAPQLGSSQVLRQQPQVNGHAGTAAVPGAPEPEPGSRPPRPPPLVLLGSAGSDPLPGEALRVRGAPASGSASSAPCQAAPTHHHGPLATRSRRPSHAGVPAFGSVVRGLAQGVYVLGWHGHFATLWVRPGGLVHLIDSLGARLAADCPLAFILEFDDVADFLAFFLARHAVRHDVASKDDIAGANLAALIEIHRLELQAAAR